MLHLTMLISAMFSLQAQQTNASQHQEREHRPDRRPWQPSHSAAIQSLDATQQIKTSPPKPDATNSALRNTRPSRSSPRDPRYPSPVPDALHHRLQQTLAAARAETEVPGVACAVYVDGEQALRTASGSRDLAGNEPLDADATFPIYSITKTLSAVCVLRLAEQGRLALDETLERWLPSLPLCRDVSLRQLLRHTAGIPNYSTVPEQIRALRESPSQAWSFDAFIRATCFHGLDFRPGEGWCYSNTGYMLIKRILELASDASFGEVVAANVLRPLGLVRSSTLESASAFAALTPGYSVLFGSNAELRDVRGAYDPGWCATGVVASTADEVCRIFEALFAGDLLRAESLEQMLELVAVPGLDRPGRPSYGLGIMGDPEAPLGRELGHGGGGPGYDLRVTHIPSLRGHAVTLAALCNRDTSEASWRIVDALRDVLAEALVEPLSARA